MNSFQIDAKNLFHSNRPECFWKCQAGLSPDMWETATRAALPTLGISGKFSNADELLDATLGEGQFGLNHWQLGFAKRLYYIIKPALPRVFTRQLRRIYSAPINSTFLLGWPVEDRYARFNWEIMKQVLLHSGKRKLPFIHFWPAGQRYAFVLTHDVETAAGQAFINQVVELETSLGFRSSFNFVPERYPLDYKLIEELKGRGFEIGVHGLKHDGKLFSSRAGFNRRVGQINRYLNEWGAVGFRAPLTHRNPEWMQALEIEYDLSFFDTDPYEPIPGGTMCIWPFQMGHFIELPYTLVQDYTLTSVLGEKTPHRWIDKVDFIERYCGMALINTHPDYLRDGQTFKVYEDFLIAMAARRNRFWHALPRDVARWWRARGMVTSIDNLSKAVIAEASLNGDELVIETPYAPTV